MPLPINQLSVQKLQQNPMQPQQGIMNNGQYYQQIPVNNNPQYQQPTGFDNAMSSFGDWFGGTDAQVNRYPIYDQQQQQARNQFLQSKMQGLGKGNFTPFRNNVMNRYENETIPSIYQRLQTMGVANSTGTPSFMAQGRANLEGELAAQEQQYNQQWDQNMMQRAAMGLTPSFDTNEQPAQPGFASQIPKILAMLAASYFGGPGAAAGVGGLMGGFDTGNITKGFSSGNNPNQFDINNMLRQFGTQQQALGGQNENPWNYQRAQLPRQFDIF